MKKIIIFLNSLIGLLVVAQNTYAQCTLNGEVVPCEDMPKWPFVFMGIFFVVMMMFLVFWVWMIIDVVRNEKEHDLLVWILILVFGGVIGAVIYYFARKRKRRVRLDVIQNNTDSKLNN